MAAGSAHGDVDTGAGGAGRAVRPVDPGSAKYHRAGIRDHPRSGKRAAGLYDGATCIKVIVNGTPADVTLEEMKAIVEEARPDGVKVAAHGGFRRDAAGECRASESALPEGLAEVFDEVGGIFEADRDADGAGGDAGGAELVEGHVVVRAVEGENDEGFDAAEAGCEEEKPGAVAETAGGGEAALQVEGHHGAKIAHLFFGELVVGMRRQAGVVDARDFGVLFEPTRDGHGGLALAADADSESFHTANEKVRGFGVHRAAKIDDRVANFVDERLAARRGASDEVGMAAEILRGAVKDDIESELDGFLQDGAGEGVVDERDEIPFAREGDSCLQVNEAEDGIGGRFDVESLCAGVDEFFDAGEVGFDVADDDAEAGKIVAHQAVGAAIGLAGGDDFVSRAEDRE